jgi:hypothetical protein
MNCYVGRSLAAPTSSLRVTFAVFFFAFVLILFFVAILFVFFRLFSNVDVRADRATRRV